MESDTVQVLTFQVGGQEVAAPLRDVRQVFRDAKITRVPHGPPSLAGVASLRGAVVPVVSVAGLLGQNPIPATALSRVILLGLAEPVAILVDAIVGLDRLEQAGVGAEAGSDGLGRLYLKGRDAVRAIDLASLLRQEFQSIRQPASWETPSGPVTPRANGPAPVEAAFITFSLQNQTYALPLETVAEVLAAPAHIAALPHTDAAMVGVITLRDGLVPVVSLRALLGLGGAAAETRARIIVVRIGASRIGLLVDRLEAILRTPPDRIEPTPAVLNRGSGEARIDAICRLPDGRGLVSILAAERIFNDETYAQIVADGRQKDAQMASSGEATKFVIFRLGSEEYGLPIADVEEVLRLPETLTRVPKAPAFVLGMMHRRGHLLPVIDQRARFGVSGAPAARGRRVLVTRLGDRQAGFAVDAVTEILSVPGDQLSPISPLTAEGGQVFDRVANLEIDGRIILLVDPQALLDRAERDLLTAFDGAGAAQP